MNDFITFPKTPPNHVFGTHFILHFILGVGMEQIGFAIVFTTSACVVHLASGLPRSSCRRKNTCHIEKSAEVSSQIDKLAIRPYRYHTATQ